MKILRFRWKNVASYGDSWQEVDISSEGGELYTLKGETGVGKSTISEVVVYGLYGKVEGKNKSDLPNRINKDLLVEIEVQCGDDHVFIRRGIAPKKFEVYINGELYDEAGEADVQKYLVREFFGIPFEVFKNLIVLSIDSFKSFLTMGAKDKREIIDKLFGFSILNQMAEIRKNEAKEVEDEIKRLEDQFNSEESSIKSINERISNLRERREKEREERRSQLEEEIERLEKERKELQNEKQEISDKYAEMDEQLRSVRDRKRDNRNKLRTLEEKMKLYKNDQCPECGSDLTTKDHLDFHKNLKKSKPKLESDIEDDEKEEKRLKKEVSQLKKKEDSKGEEVRKKKSEKERKEKEQSNLDQESNDTEENLVNIRSEHEEKKSNVLKDLNEKKAQNYFMSNVKRAIDVKSRVVEKILPPLNHSIAMVSDRMNFPYFMRFDEEFNCIVSSMGEDINPSTLSTGQRKKANFIIVVSMLDLIQTMYPNLNLIFLDEMLSQIDGNSRHEVIEIISELVYEHDLKAWLVQHEELPTELFDKEAVVTFDGTFSDLEISEVE